MKSLKSLIWYEKYRQTELSQLALPKEQRKAFEHFIKKEEIPHLLFYGPPGSGKTTTATIFISKIGSSKLILNASSADRGVNTVKTTVKRFATTKRKDKRMNIVLMDECFAKGTVVTTQFEEKTIESISIGEKIINIGGIDEVEKITLTKVPLDRVIYIKFKSKKPIFCSIDHRFLTHVGWVKAKDINKSDIFMEYNNGCKKKKSFKSKMCVVQRMVRELCYKRTILREVQNHSFYLQKLWRYIHNTYTIQKERLFKFLFVNLKKPKGGFQEENIQQKDIQKNIKICKKMDENRGGNKTQKRNIQENEGPNGKGTFKRSYKERYRDKKRKWGFIFCKAWWEWTVYKTANAFIWSFELAYGSQGQNRATYPSWKKTGVVEEEQISNSICNRYSKQKAKTGCRDRWEKTQFEEGKITGLQKDKKVRKIGVENIEIYKQRSNDEYFECIIGDKERSQGYVEFYDLKVKKHPSYIANGIIVHNSDGLTPQAQMALKNTIETYQKNCRFIFTANNLAEVIPEIISRCLLFKFDTVPQKKLIKHLEMILEKEGIEYKKKNIKKIIERFYPDVRSVINNIQACSIGGKLNPKNVIDSFDTDLVNHYIKKGRLFALRHMWLGAVDFIWLYKYLFNSFIPNEMSDEVKAEAAITVAEYLHRDRTVADREINMSACCLELMNLLEADIDFSEPF